jgi:hypothetical protein
MHQHRPEGSEPANFGPFASLHIVRTERLMPRNQKICVVKLSDCSWDRASFVCMTGHHRISVKMGVKCLLRPRQEIKLYLHIVTTEWFPIWCRRHVRAPLELFSSSAFSVNWSCTAHEFGNAGDALIMHRVCDKVGWASGGAYGFTPLPLHLLLCPLSIWYPYWLVTI